MRPIRTILTALGATGLAATLAFGQATPSEAPAIHAHHQMRARRGNWRKLMAGYLGLTDQQQAKAKSIFASAHESAQPLRQQLKQARADLRSAIQAGQPVDELAANQGKILGQLAGIRANAAEQFRSILTPQQLQKLQDLHSNRRTNSQRS